MAPELAVLCGGVPGVAWDAGFFEGFGEASSVGEMRATAWPLVPDPAGEEASRESVRGHAGHMPGPAQVTAGDVGINVAKAEAAVDVTRGDVVESAMAS